MKKSNIFLGGLLILIGLMSIFHRLNYFGLFSSKFIFALAILILGIAFDLSYFIGRKSSTNLVPGGILITLGIYYIFKSYFYIGALNVVTWQIYALSLSVGLYQLYIFAGRERSNFILATVLAVISIFSATSNIFKIILPVWFDKNFILPVILIVVGIYVLFRSSKN